MGILEVLLISVGLAMDAFAVSICKGLSIKNVKLKDMIIIGVYFGMFQAGMPVIGFFLGNKFESFVTQIDHWIAFGLLAIIGGNMIFETFKKKESVNSDIGFRQMIILAIATSIDALAVGITFAFLEANITFAILMIGVITFAISVLGVIIGSRFGNRFEKKAQIFGGVILICMGLHILVEHLWGG